MAIEVFRMQVIQVQRKLKSRFSGYPHWGRISQIESATKYKTEVSQDPPKRALLLTG